jgi:transposase
MNNNMFVRTNKYNQVESREYSLMTPKVIMHPRLAWMLYYKEVKNVKKVAERFNISRKTFYKWWSRYHHSRAKPASLVNVSKKPHYSPMATPPCIIQKVIEAKLKTGFGQRKLREYLSANCNINLSEHTIWKLIKQNRTDKFNHSETSNNLEAPKQDIQPGDEIQIATLDIRSYLNHSSQVMYSAVDKATHLRISKIYFDSSTESTIKFIKLIIDKFPFKIRLLGTPANQIFNCLHRGNEIRQLKNDFINPLLKRDGIRHQSFTDDSLDKPLIVEMLTYDEERFLKIKILDSIEDANIQLKKYIDHFNNHNISPINNNLTPLQNIRLFQNFKTLYYFDPLD